MKFRVLNLAIAAVLTVPTIAPAQQDEHILQAEARASVTVQFVDAQPAFDPAFADSRAASSAVGTSSLQSVQWPGFLADAFFFLYGFQSVERIALGISEARWPQGPTSARATHSDLLFANAGDPSSLPGSVGRSEATASEGEAAGTVAAGGFAFPGGTIGSARSTSHVETVGAVAHASASQRLTELSIGPLFIEALLGSAEVRAAEGQASASLVIVGADVAGTPVIVTEEGVRAQREVAQDAVDAALAGHGLDVRLLSATRTADGNEAAASSGGLRVDLIVRATDPTGTPRDVRVGYVFGAASATASAVPLAVTPPPVDPPTIIRPGRTVVTVLPAAGPPPEVSETVEEPLIRRRVVVTTAATGLPGGAKGAYAMLFVVAIGLLGLRPLMRAGSRA